VKAMPASVMAAMRNGFLRLDFMFLIQVDGVAGWWMFRPSSGRDFKWAW
jgi:hypothetical protein